MTRHSSLASDTGPIAALSTAHSVNSLEFFRSTARIGVEVAQALDHAHQQGVVHRDIKPSNLMIDAHGKIWVTDFGLAQIETNTQLTMTGDVIGTLRYISPEQATGKSGFVDHRADIYSLGATLYELLTLQPLFPATHRHELLRQVADDEPAAPRKLNSAIPAELETIVLKAIAKIRDERYATAAELADDLQRFLNDKPIHAKRPSLALRTAKWSRRHKPIVWSAVVVLLIATLSLSVSTVLLSRKQAELVQQRNDAHALRIQKEQNLRLAFAALEKIVVPLSEKQVLQETDLTSAERDLLQNVLSFYEQIARNNQNTSAARYEVAKAYRRVGEIKQALGLHQDAQRVFNRAIDDFSKLQREFPEQTEYRQTLAASYNNLGNALQAQKNYHEAQTAYRQAVDLQQILLEEFPLDPDHRAALADSHNNLGVLLVTTGNALQAQQAFSQSGEFWQTLADEHPRLPLYRYRLSSVQINLANLAKEMGQPDQAQQLIQDALKSTSMLVDQFPNRRHYRAQLARGHNTLGLLLKQSEQFQQAETAWNTSGSLWERLVDEWPNIPRYQQELGAAYNNSASLLRMLRRHQESTDAYRHAADVRRRLVRKFPHVQAYEEDLARTCNTLGDMLRSQPHTSPEAATWFREAGDHWENLAADSPLTSNYQQQLSQTSNKLGILLAPQDPAAATQAYQKSLIALQNFADLDPENSLKPGFRDSFAKTHHNLGLLLTGLRPQQAEPSLRIALEEFRKLQADYPKNLNYRVNVVTAVNALGNLTLSTGRKHDAKPFFQQTRELRTELATKFPRQPALQNSLAWFLATCPDPEFRNPSRAVTFAQKAVQREKRKGHYFNTLGVALYRAGRWKSARKVLDASVSLNEGGDGNDWIFLAMTHWQLKNHEQAHHWYHKAANWITGNNPHDLELKRFRIEAEQLLGIPVPAPVPQLGKTRKQHVPANVFLKRRKTFVSITPLYRRLRLSAPLTSIVEPVG